jgi:hypothetical protein
VEQWKPIKGTEGKIEISNLGRVRSLLRDCRILKPQKDSKGYLRISVTISRRKTTFKVHREVAKAFLSNPHNLPQVNHLDGKKENNQVGNLEWCDNINNAHHAISKGLWENVFKASAKTNEKRKRPVIACDISTNKPRCFGSISSAERELGTKHINAVIKGERKQANGYTFRYADAGVMANDGT